VQAKKCDGGIFEEAAFQEEEAVMTFYQDPRDPDPREWSKREKIGMGLLVAVVVFLLVLVLIGWVTGRWEYQ
jgi:hypothetical protein